jgi:hypothetical protein
MGSFEEKAKETIDGATTAAKRASKNIVNKSRDIAKKAAKTLKKGRKRLQDT